MLAVLDLTALDLSFHKTLLVLLLPQLAGLVVFGLEPAVISTNPEPGYAQQVTADRVKLNVTDLELLHLLH